MGKKILLVDDDPAVRRIVSEILRLEGYEIREAAEGAESLKAVPEFRPDLVLLDVELPGLDGMEICKRLKQQPATAGLSVALISGRAMDLGDKAAGFAAGADEYFTKPVDGEEFPARIAMLLRLAETSAALRASEREHREAEAKYRSIL